MSIHDQHTLIIYHLCSQIWAETLGSGYKSIKGVRNIAIALASDGRKKHSPTIDLYISDKT